MVKKHPSILKLLNLKFHPHENHFNNNGIIVFLLLSEQSIDNNDRPLNVFFFNFFEKFKLQKNRLFIRCLCVVYFIYEDLHKTEC